MVIMPEVGAWVRGRSQRDTLQVLLMATRELALGLAWEPGPPGAYFANYKIMIRPFFVRLCGFVPLW